MAEETPMLARIYRPTRTAMQAGMAGSREWILEYEREKPRLIEPLMGWTSSGDMRSQIRLRFKSKEEVVAYAKRNGIPFRIDEPEQPKLEPKSYADNFKFGRLDPWTH
jgi:hypothetical protein